MNKPLSLPGRTQSRRYADVEYGSDAHMEKLYSMDIKYMIHCIKTEGWAFIFICGYLFFEYVRIQSSYSWLDFLPWPTVFIALAFLAMFSDSRSNVSTSHPLSKLMVLYAIVVLASASVSEYPSVSFDHLRKYLDWMVIYFLIVKIINTRTRFFIFFLSFLIYSFKMSQHGFLTFALRGFSFEGWGVGGGPGWFQNSGEFGIQMAIYVPISLMFAIALRGYWNKWWKAFFYAMPFTGVFSVVASSSRGAMLGLAANALMGLYRTKYFFRTVLVVAVAAVLVWQVVPEEFKARFETAGEDRTSLHRIERWEDGWSTMKEKPLLGVGHSAWEVYYPNHFVPEIKGSKLVHNVFIQAGTELGFIGLGVLLVLIFVAFRTHNKIRKRAHEVGDRFYYMLTYGMDMGLVGLMISASFVTVLYYPFFWIFFALTATMSNSFEACYKKVPKKPISAAGLKSQQYAS